MDQSKKDLNCFSVSCSVLRSQVTILYAKCQFERKENEQKERRIKFQKIEKLSGIL